MPVSSNRENVSTMAPIAPGIRSTSGLRKSR